MKTKSKLKKYLYLINIPKDITPIDIQGIINAQKALYPYIKDDTKIASLETLIDRAIVSKRESMKGGLQLRPFICTEDTFETRKYEIESMLGFIRWVNEHGVSNKEIEVIENEN